MSVFHIRSTSCRMVPVWRQQLQRAGISSGGLRRCPKPSRANSKVVRANVSCHCNRWLTQETPGAAATTRDVGDGVQRWRGIHVLRRHVGVRPPSMEFRPMTPLPLSQARGGVATRLWMARQGAALHPLLCAVRPGSLWRRAAHLRTLSLDRARNDRVVGWFLEK